MFTVCEQKYTTNFMQTTTTYTENNNKNACLLGFCIRLTQINVEQQTFLTSTVSFLNCCQDDLVLNCVVNVYYKSIPRTVHGQILFTRAMPLIWEGQINNYFNFYPLYAEQKSLSQYLFSLSFLWCVFKYVVCTVCRIWNCYFFSAVFHFAPCQACKQHGSYTSKMSCKLFCKIAEMIIQPIIQCLANVSMLLELLKILARHKQRHQCILSEIYSICAPSCISAVLLCIRHFSPLDWDSFAI